MRLTDIMSGMDLAVWPTAALILFMGSFAAVVWWVFARGNQARWERASHAALDDRMTPHPSNEPERRAP